MPRIRTGQSPESAAESCGCHGSRDPGARDPLAGSGCSVTGVTGLGGLRDAQVASLQTPPSEAPPRQPRPGPPCSSGHCHLSPGCRDLTLTRDQCGLQDSPHPLTPLPTHSPALCRTGVLSLGPTRVPGGPGHGSDEADRAQARGRPARGPVGDPLSADAVALLPWTPWLSPRVTAHSMVRPGLRRPHPPDQLSAPRTPGCGSSEPAGGGGTPLSRSCGRCRWTSCGATVGIGSWPVASGQARGGPGGARFSAGAAEGATWSQTGRDTPVELLRPPEPPPTESWPPPPGPAGCSGLTQSPRPPEQDAPENCAATPPTSGPRGRGKRDGGAPGAAHGAAT